MTDFTPALRKRVFTCPHCSAIGAQVWAENTFFAEEFDTNHQPLFIDWDDLMRARCGACDDCSIWIRNRGAERAKASLELLDGAMGGRRPQEPNLPVEPIWTMIWPKKSGAPLPHEALPEELKQLHSEARAVLADSPRAAAALLRLLMEKLLQDTTGKTGNLNEQIGLLVERGTFDQRLQETADTIRVSGNKAVHPAQIQSQGDTEEVALIMFELVNFLVDDLIARPRKISHLFETTVPEGAREAIARRDGDKA